MPKYHNTEPHPLQSLGGFLRWQWQRIRTGRAPRGRVPTPSRALPVDRVPIRALTWIGHATFLLDLGGFTVLTDPHFSDRASPSQRFGPRRLVPPAVALEDLPPIDLILLSHNHYDHLDRSSLLRLADLGPPGRTVVPPGLGSKLKRWGLEATTELDWWDSLQAGDVGVGAVPVKHSSCRWGPDRNRTGWNGYVVESGDWSFFFAGDTAYSRDFGHIRRRRGPIDLALLPIGAYEPRWFMRHVHATPEEAVEIHLDLGATRSVAMHWGTFVLTDEPVDEPPRRLRRARQDHGLGADEFVVLEHGESLPLE